MDMAIQSRENDLVLGTHGRSIYIIDDYSSLRGLKPADFDKRLAILSATPGQQYLAAMAPSTRFTGSGEFRAENEPYGVMITFMASGKDLPHPDEDAEKVRKAALRESATNASIAAVAEPATGKTGDVNKKPPKVSVVVSDSAGAVVRNFTHPVVQGINRLTWDQSHDGVRPMPGPTPPEPDADLPPGVEVPPGDYQLHISLGGGEQNAVEDTITVTVLPDPRVDIGAAQRAAHYQSMLTLQELQAANVSGVEFIVHTRSDLDTVDRLIAQQSPGENKAALEKLTEQSANLRKRLEAVEAKFRVPPETRGAIYSDDRVDSRIGLAQAYVGSSPGEATQAAAAYLKLAQQSLANAQQEMEALKSGELAAFRSAVNQAGISLLSPAAP
jgi:hypothetical protein